MNSDITELVADLVFDGVVVRCPETGCDHSVTAYGGRIEHHDDGSHTFLYDADPVDLDRSQPLIVTGAFVTVPVSKGAQLAIERVVRAHVEEFDAALAAHGLKISDVAVPEFERLVYRAEVQG